MHYRTLANRLSVNEHGSFRRQKRTTKHLPSTRPQRQRVLCALSAAPLAANTYPLGVRSYALHDKGHFYLETHTKKAKEEFAGAPIGYYGWQHSPHGRAS